MFRNIQLSVFLFFVIVTLLIVSLYSFLDAQSIPLPYLIAITLFVVFIAGYAMVKLALEPLQEQLSQLEHFSKEILHELNLPINTIMSNTSMLKKGVDEPKALKRFGRIEVACEMLQERYRELDYLIKKQMYLEQVETFDVAQLVRERLNLLKPLYSSANIEDNLESISVNIDRIGLAKVIDNIIDNSVKYSAAPASVSVNLKESILEIRDSGFGMDELEVFQIFDRYYQSDDAEHGYGIGLGLVKSYCDKYKIKLHVSSQKGTGTTMQLDFSGVR